MISKQKFSNAMAKYSKIQPNYCPDFTDGYVLDFWYSCLSNIPIEKLAPAFDKLCCKSRFPCIDDIKAECGVGEVTDEMIARDVASRIENAVIRFMSKKRWPEIVEAMGPIGVEVVGGENGYYRMVDMLRDGDMPTYRAQWRELAKAKIQLQKAGKLNKAPQFPTNNATLSLIEKSVKGLAKI